MPCTLWSAIAIALLAILSACGGNGHDAAAGSGSGTGISKNIPGILIPGLTTELAQSKLDDYAAIRSEADMSTISVPPSDTVYYLQHLFAIIRPGATVGEVNAALETVGGRIGYSARRSRVVTIQVPNPGSLAALNAVAARLVASGSFTSVQPAVGVVPNSLPSNVSTAEAGINGGPTLHHIASNFASAWNAKGAAATSAPIRFIIVDYFGSGNLSELNGTATGIASGFECNSCQHGYHVLGIATGSYGGALTSVGKVTGSSQGNFNIDVVDLAAIPKGVIPEEYIYTGIKEAITKSPQSKFVLNMSLGACNTPGDCMTEETSKGLAEIWRTRVRELWPKLPVTQPFDYDNQLIQVTSAGNGGSSAKASHNSAWNAAVLMGKIGLEPPLINGLVVENRTVKFSVSGLPRPGDVAVSSSIGGNIAAIGENVYSFTSPTTVGLKNGTSMASPQVAGLAASMLAVRPTFNSSQIISIIIAKRFSPDSSLAPAIDAYAALLALDKSIDDAPVRSAILRVSSENLSSDFGFRYVDVIMFLQAFFPLAYDGEPTQTSPRFSRFDLNGDGYDGESNRTFPFDLEFNDSSTKFIPAAISRYLIGDGSQILLNENSVTDFEILCFYINSPLFNQSDKQSVDLELARISSLPALGKKVSCAEPTVVLLVNDVNSAWVGLPARISLTNFVPVFPATIFGNSATCTNQGAATGERGSPFYSASVPKTIGLQAALSVSGIPALTTGGTVNRNNCSSFYASLGSKVWINATGRAVFGFGGSVVSDWEYQIRYTNGINGTGSQCTVGVVPNSGIFVPSFQSVCAHTVLTSIAQ